MAKGMQDGGIHGNEYSVGALLRAYAEVGGNAAFMYDVSQKNNPPVNTAERFVETLAGLNQNAKASSKVADAVSHFVTTMQDMGSAVPTEVHDTIMAAYRTFEAGGTNNNAFAVMQTALQSIDNAIVQGLVSGGDVTGMVALRSQMESGLSGSVRQSVFGSRTVNAKAMADAVTLLMKLPADVQGAIDKEALSQAYFDFLTAGKEGKTAAQAKAVEVLFASMNAAIATGKLDAAAVQELQGLMAEIGSEKSRNIVDISVLIDSIQNAVSIEEAIKVLNSISFSKYTDNIIYILIEKTYGHSKLSKADQKVVCKLIAEKGHWIGKYYNEDMSIIWPANHGFKKIYGKKTLVKGEVVDRYGFSSGSYLSPVNTSYDERSLAPGTKENRRIVKYIVIEPFSVYYGSIAPWFGKPGGGIQFWLGEDIHGAEISVQQLIDDEIIKEVIENG